jgi:hypothetical protein
MTAAHVGGLPLEELLALAPAAGGLWLALRGGLARGVGQVPDPAAISSAARSPDSTAPSR